LGGAKVSKDRDLQRKVAVSGGAKPDEESMDLVNTVAKNLRKAMNDGTDYLAYTDPKVPETTREFYRRGARFILQLDGER
jgi:hypothetical protein